MGASHCVITVWETVRAILARPQQVDDTDIANHAGAFPDLPLVGSAQAYLVASQQHVHTFLHRRRGGAMEELGGLDAGQELTDRLQPKIRSKNAFRHSRLPGADRVNQGES